MVSASGFFVCLFVSIFYIQIAQETINCLPQWKGNINNNLVIFNHYCPIKIQKLIFYKMIHEF